MKPRLRADWVVSIEVRVMNPQSQCILRHEQSDSPKNDLSSFWRRKLAVGCSTLVDVYMRSKVIRFLQFLENYQKFQAFLTFQAWQSDEAFLACHSEESPASMPGIPFRPSVCLSCHSLSQPVQLIIQFIELLSKSHKFQTFLTFQACEFDESPWPACLTYHSDESSHA